MFSDMFDNGSENISSYTILSDTRPWMYCGTIALFGIYHTLRLYYTVVLNGIAYLTDGSELYCTDGYQATSESLLYCSASGRCL